MKSSFPENFSWGAATASYQIEGGAFADGKGKSVWDMMSHWSGKVYNGDTGDVGCDHYNHLDEDVRLMKQIGLKAYRFSLSWPRILPDGTGSVNEAGLAFYDRLVDKLLEAGIQPFITLFHWDYPYELFCRGGWLSPESPGWFAEYTRVVVNRLGDRVKHWMTLNEPQVFIGFGHVKGEHAPGLKLGWTEYCRITHHVLLAHGRAVQEIREHSGSSAHIGWAPVGDVRMPRDNQPGNIDAAREDMFAIHEPEYWTNTWYMDPVVFGHYPEDGLKHFEPYMPRIGSDDMDIISTPIDFIGLNIYMGFPVGRTTDGSIARVKPEQGHALTAFNWVVTPDCLYWGPRFFAERYQKPIYITENGLSSMDWVHLDGSVPDSGRIDFLTRYIRELKRAVAEGVDVRGYFQWSLMDNFEWARGYGERFGLIYIDYATGKRIPKLSADWYRKLIETNGAHV